MDDEVGGGFCPLSSFTFASDSSSFLWLFMSCSRTINRVSSCFLALPRWLSILFSVKSRYFCCLMAAWLSGNALVLINVQRSCSTPGPVSTGIGDRSRVYRVGIWPKPPRPTQLINLGRHNEYWRWSRSPLGKKLRVLRNIGPVPGLLAY